MMRPRFRFSLGRMMVAVAVIALALVEARLATLLVVLTVTAMAIRSLLLHRGEVDRRSWEIPFLVTATSLYLPFAWLLGDFPWDGYRRLWLTLWPVLPGLVAGLFVHRDNQVMFLISGAATLVLLTLFTRLGCLGRKTLVAVNLIALVGASVESWIAYELFLM